MTDYYISIQNNNPNNVGTCATNQYAINSIVKGKENPNFDSTTIPQINNSQSENDVRDKLKEYIRHENRNVISYVSGDAFYYKGYYKYPSPIYTIP